MTTNKPEVVAWYTQDGYALMNELVPRERFPKDRPEPLIRQSDHIAEVRGLVEALAKIAQGEIEEGGFLVAMSGEECMQVAYDALAAHRKHEASSRYMFDRNFAACKGIEELQ